MDGQDTLLWPEPCLPFLLSRTSLVVRLCSLALSTSENPIQKQKPLGKVAQSIFALEPKARGSSLQLNEDSFQNICVGQFANNCLI